MKELYLENSPIAYYIDDTANKDWIVFVHAAFADRRMFAKQYPTNTKVKYCRLPASAATI